MSNISVITTCAPDAWTRALERCVPYDFYHLPQYHLMAEEAGEGEAHLLVYDECEYTIAFPLLLRSLGELPFTPSCETGWRDATSVYGYPGPICSHREIPGAVVQNFQSALQEWLRALRIVAVFSRLHPFFSPLALLSGLGERQVSRTVSIDLTLSPEVQRSRYRDSFKVGINKLRRCGLLTCLHDQEGVYLEDFIRIYHETMCRVQASERYFFSPAYFRKLWEILDSRIHLFVCLQESRAVAGGLFMSCNGILQSHLTGTLNEALKLAPVRLMIDEARLWGTAQGLSVLHLGGGVSSRPDDSLFHFKKGFSDRVHECSVWRWVQFPAVYQRLCEEHSRWSEQHHLQAADSNYFPEYRRPTISRASMIDSALVAAVQERQAGREKGREKVSGPD